MYLCRWLVLCETVVHDSKSNNLTMVNSITQIKTASFPALYTKFAFAAILDLEGEPDGPLSLRFVRETKTGKEVLVTLRSDESTPSRVQTFLNFPLGIRLNEEGIVQFHIEAREGDSDWYIVGSQNINVGTIEQQEGVVSHESTGQGKPASRDE
jgi:hypothetical protein